MGWFLLSRFADLLRVCSLHSIRRIVPTSLSKISQQGLFVLISRFWQIETSFRPLRNIYFNYKQSSRRPNLSSSLRRIPLCCNFFRIEQKKSHLLQQMTELYQQYDGLSNIFFRILRYSGKVRQKKEKLAIPSKRN